MWEKDAQRHRGLALDIHAKRGTLLPRVRFHLPNLASRQALRAEAT